MAKNKAAADFSSFVKNRKAEEQPETERKGGRADEKLITARVTRQQWERLQHLCIAEDTSIQDIITEAPADWVHKHGLAW
jgi:hypothetical protein